MRNHRAKNTLSLAAVVGVIALAVTGCSSSSTTATTGTSTKSSAALTAFAQKAEAATTAALATQTSHVPTSASPAQTGKSVVIVPPAGSTTEGGYRISLAAADAAKSLGWKVTYINPNGDLNQMNAAVQKAIAIGANGVITVSIDGNAILSALQQAKAKGITLIGAAAANSKGETGVYDSMVPDVASGEANGYLAGQEAYVKNKGVVHAIDMSVQGFGYVDARERGWNKFIVDCQKAGGDCKILTTAKFSGADIVSKLPQLTASTVRLNPTYNVLWTGFDSGLPFMIQGMQAAGLDTSKTMAIGFDGNTANLDMIRKKGFEQATVGLSTLCIGYAAVDNMNRIFAGQDPLVGDAQGCQNKLLTSANVPKSGPWWGDVDVRPAYWKLWGITAPTSPAAVDTL